MKRIVQFFRALMMILRLGPDKIVELQRQALYDSLTKLYNRRYLESIGSREITRVERYQNPLSMIFIDVNGLKPINDKEGHHEGDQVLKSVACLLTRTCRASDIVVRLGGDEFVVLAIETGKKTIKSLVDRIKHGAQKLPRPIGLSCGIAIWRPGLSLEGLLKEADTNMYRDKNDSSTRRR